MLFVLDEAQSISPRLLTEMLAEGRKFGVGVVLASQYADRWSPELRAAAAGSAGTHVLFRVPAAGARSAAAWAGLAPEVAERLLPTLPPGLAVVRSPSNAARLFHGGRIAAAEPGHWDLHVAASAARFGAEPPRTPERGEEEALLFHVWGAEERAEPLSRGAAARAMVPDDGPAGSAELLLDRLLRRGWLEERDGRLSVTTAGGRRLGIGAPSNAPTESEEHRALLGEAMRVLARKGVRLVLLRQGRFDRRLPDGVVRLTPTGEATTPAEDLLRLEGARSTWAWRYFHGRDVHVEAEVSGALRPERIRRDLAKARPHGRFVLFLVADPQRARRIRVVLGASRTGRDRATIWTLPRAARRQVPD